MSIALFGLRYYENIPTKTGGPCHLTGTDLTRLAQAMG